MIIKAENVFGASLVATAYYDQVQQKLHDKIGEVFKAVFTFRMPILPRGKCAVDVAIADGVSPDVVQRQWLHDAIVVELHSSSVSTGFIGIDFDNIEIRTVPNALA